MCAEVHLRDGTVIENVGQLRAAGWEPVIDHRYDDDVEDIDCLCSVDLRETFRVAGTGWTYSEPEDVYRIPFDPEDET